MISYEMFKAMCGDCDRATIVMPSVDPDRVYLSTDNWDLITDVKYWDQNFIHYLSTVKDQFVDPEVLWSSFCDWPNNIFRGKNGGTNRTINHGAKPYRNRNKVSVNRIQTLVRKYMSSNTIKIFDKSNNINYFKETEPTYQTSLRGKTLDFSSRILNNPSTGMFADFQTLEFSTGTNERGKQEDRLLNIRGNVVKVAVEHGLCVEVLNLCSVDMPTEEQKGLYYFITSDGFYWIVKAERDPRGKGNRKFDCGRSLKLHPINTSWIDEKQAIQGLISCKRVYNPLFQPPPDLSLAQRSEFWSGSDAQVGIETLKWKNWSDDEIMALIESNRERVENAYWDQFVDKMSIKLRDDINEKVNKNPNMFQREWETTWRNILDTGEAFSKKSNHFQLSAAAQQAFQDLTHFMNLRRSQV